MQELLRRILKAASNPRLVWRRLIIRMPHVFKVSYRVVVSRVGIIRAKYIRKKFENTQIGRSCFDCEMLANEIFSCFYWKPPVVRKGPLWFTIPFYPEKKRLDLLGPYLPEATRRRIGTEAVSILFDIFCAGYAHRDIHCKNMYWVNKNLKLTDYEWMEAYPKGERPPFPLSYDITGKGLESPGRTGNICYTKDHELALQNILGIPIEKALNDFKEILKDRLRLACETFSTGTKRHVCRARRIYSSFSLPYFSVEVSEAQRDSARRLALFAINKDILQNKSLLDLGCNTGGMIFEAQKFKPAQCVGVEYDSDKVELATKITAYCGLNNTKFICGDIDEVNMQKIGGKFDVIFCLAIEAHIKKKSRLYQFLAEISNNVIYFEGNSTTNVQQVKDQLLTGGFNKVEFLGFSDDDCLPDNNCRPLIRARK